MKTNSMLNLVFLIFLKLNSLNSEIDISQLSPLYEGFNEVVFFLANNETESDEEKFHELTKKSTFNGLSIQNLSRLGSSDLFCCRQLNPVAIFIISLDQSSFLQSLTQVCKSLQCETGKTYWIPPIFLYYPVKNSSLWEYYEVDILSSYNSSCLSLGNPLKINSQAYIIAENFDTHSGSISELYSLPHKTFLRKVDLQQGIHVSLTGLAQTGGVLLRRQNFMEAHIKAVAQEDFTESVEFADVDGTVTFAGGFDPEYFEVMTKSLNIRIVAVRGMGWIALNTTDGNSLLGMGQQLLSGEADISITHSEYLQYRGKKLTFLHPHYVSRITAYFRQPATKSVPDLYSQALEAMGFAFPASWLLVLTSLLTISWIQCKFLSQNQISSKRAEPSQDSFENAVLWVIGSFCLQGSKIQPRSVHMKIGVIISLFFGSLMYITLSVSLVSQLSVPTIPIRTFDDILRYRMNLYRDDVTNSISGLLSWIRHDKKEYELIPESGLKRISAQEGLEKISYESSAYLTLPDEFYSIVRTSDLYFCEQISQVPADPIKSPVFEGMMVPKGSPYTEFFTFKQLQMREGGIHHRLLKRYGELIEPKCLKTRPKSMFDLGLNDTAIAFVFLALSFIVSLITLSIEIALRNYESETTTKIYHHSTGNQHLQTGLNTAGKKTPRPAIIKTELTQPRIAKIY